ncbi:MAG: hypothetical protein QOJ01_1178 [Solirubrobacterales bacterium]|jgi:ketosteroid isomerase-like protein|nr:hypothetical protein [Solirubrobacterales bacterium]
MEFDQALIDDLLVAMPIGNLLPDTPEAAAARATALAKFASEDLETVMVGGAVGLTAEFHGYEGFAAAWADWLSAFERYESELDEVVEGRDGALLVLTRQLATPKGGDATIESRAAAVLRFRGEKLARIEFHLDPATARRAAGLEEN